MAAPHVAGLAALLLSHDPGLTAAEVERLILGTADAFGPGGQINGGHALHALQHVKGHGIENRAIRRHAPTGGTVQSVIGPTYYVFSSGYSGAAAAGGVYLVRRHEMRWQVTPAESVAILEAARRQVGAASASCGAAPAAPPSVTSRTFASTASP